MCPMGSLKMKNRQGFTLMEMILVMSITVFVLVTVYSTFYSGMKFNSRAQNESLVFRQARWALKGLERELENMVAYDFSGSYEDKFAFKGADDEITFLTNVQGNIRVVTYMLMPAQDVKIHQVLVDRSASDQARTVVAQTRSAQAVEYLVRKERSLLDYLSGDLPEHINVEIVSKNVKADGLKFSFAFFQVEGGTQEVKQGTWALNQIPLSVSVDIQFVAHNPKGEEIVAFHKDFLLPHGVIGSSQGES